MTPALWGRLQGEHHHHREEKWGEDYKPLHAPPDYGKQQVQRQVDDQPSYQASAAQPAQEQKEKHWYDIDDKHKKELEVLSRSALLVGNLICDRSVEVSSQGSQRSVRAIMHTSSTKRNRRR